MWLYASSRDQEILDNVPVPVHICLAPGQADHYDLEITGPSQVTVSFTGPPSPSGSCAAFYSAAKCRSKSHSPCPRSVSKRAVTWTPYSSLPGRPDTARRDAGRRRGAEPHSGDVAARGPAPLAGAAELRREDRIAQITLEPPTVLVRGPQEVLDRARSLATDMFPLPAQPRSRSGRDRRERRRHPGYGDWKGPTHPCKPGRRSSALTLQAAAKTLRPE